jgi:hypothetical protein
MDSKVLTLISCSTSISAILGSATLVSPDTSQTIPFPEVMNLDTVPTFDRQGIVIAQKPDMERQKIGRVTSNPKKSHQASVPKAKAVVKLSSNDIESDCANCHNQMRGLMMTNHNTYTEIKVY